MFINCVTRLLVLETMGVREKAGNGGKNWEKFFVYKVLASGGKDGLGYTPSPCFFGML